MSPITPELVASMYDGLRNSLFYYPDLFMSEPKSAKYQFHWWNRSDLTQTRFVEESPPINSFEEAEAWLKRVSERHEGKCPEGWVPLVCNEESEHFVPGMAPLTPEQAQAAYDTAEPVHLSEERVRDIVRYATGKNGD